MKLSSLFSEFSIPTNERELRFLKMMWKILALSLFNVLYLNHYSMHVFRSHRESGKSLSCQEILRF